MTCRHDLWMLLLLLLPPTSTDRVELFGRLGPSHLVVDALLGRKRLLIRQIGIGVQRLVTTAARRWKVQRVDNHVVVQHLGLVD